jgi:hypothetical protein
MDVFSLSDRIVADYGAFSRSFTPIRSPDIKAYVDAQYDSGRFWPEPLIQINPRFQSGGSVAGLVSDGLLHADAGRIFSKNGQPLDLHLHQKQAISKARSGQSFVVTTGTGSGKSLCYLIPIIDHVLRARSDTGKQGTCAIVIYPMNALANSQIEEAQKFLRNIDGPEKPTVARFTGQEDAAEREAISANPPDILLTNFMMLEYLLTRRSAQDARVISNCEGLRFLVLDELHTYRGRQGADVAMLVRRVRERLAPDGNLICIGTSATMSSKGDAMERRRTVSNVASTLFATDIPPQNVLVEALKRRTELPGNIAASTLVEMVRRQLPKAMPDAVMAHDPMATWIETRLGLDKSDSGDPERRRPVDLERAASMLSQESGEPLDECRRALSGFLLLASKGDKDRGGDPKEERPFFPFRLHRFLSGAGVLHATLEPAGRREFHFDGQVFAPGRDDNEGARLFGTYFCRKCGHEHHPTYKMRGDETVFRAREIDDMPDEDDTFDAEADKVAGFLVPTPQGDEERTFQGEISDYPENWQNERGNALVATYRKRIGERVTLATDGSQMAAGTDYWFFPGKHRFCACCGTSNNGQGRDMTHLAGITSEGRSSATTVLVTSMLEWLNDGSGLEKPRRKVLAFTDNRQDAALQAGHFNDTVFVTILRAGFLKAVQDAGSAGLRGDRLGTAIQQALRFTQGNEDRFEDWIIDAGQGRRLTLTAIEDAEETMGEMLAYRGWIDQQRGWRYTNPNLEGLGLIRVDYRGIEDVVDHAAVSGHPLFVDLTAAQREAVVRAVLDHVRRAVAVNALVLRNAKIDELKQQSTSRLRSPWGLGENEKAMTARTAIFGQRPSGRNPDDDIEIRSGARSALGRALRSRTTFGWASRLTEAQTQDVIETVFAAAAETNLFRPSGAGHQIDVGRVLFRAVEDADPKNLFFANLYSLTAQALGERAAIFGFEGREHTAQVTNELRQVRETRFRTDDQAVIRQMMADQDFDTPPEPARFLPTLFCSPTMELGVDIADLNVVYLRNAPPTPANYAQRSGRAGRSGQAALVVTYCSAMSPHDNYYFRNKEDLVYGVVEAPSLDLVNRELVESHFHATWLSCVREEFGSSITDIVDIETADRPIRKEISAALSAPHVAKDAAARIRRLLTDDLGARLTPESAPWIADPDAFVDELIAQAPERFDYAFERWRNLLTDAERLRDRAHQINQDLSQPTDVRRQATRDYAVAMSQIDALRADSGGKSFNDFYLYRYLATEGFLPGYNFPRLPLRAFIPTTGSKRTFVQRARFLAISEFGPNSIIYHEGRTFRVHRAKLPVNATEDGSLRLRRLRICHSCGASHSEDGINRCHACDAELTDNSDLITNILPIEAVDARPTQRITANDEERRRQGFDIQTTFHWPVRAHEGPQFRKSRLTAEGVDLGGVQFATGATITRINKGLRRAAPGPTGFSINVGSGLWKREDEGGDPSQRYEFVVPLVSDTKNVMLVMPPASVMMSNGVTTAATILYALVRGIEAEFTIEEGEILTENLPSREDRKAFLLYEAVEGGAGVLSRLSREQHAFAKVARRALEIMHWSMGGRAIPDLPDEDIARLTVASLTNTKADCVAGCYECLLSYFNQPEHENIDRRDEAALTYLVGLAKSSLAIDHDASIRTARNGAAHQAGASDSAADLWMAAASAHGITIGVDNLISIDGAVLPASWRHAGVVAVRSGETCDEERLANLGIVTLSFSEHPDSWPERFAELKGLIG